MTTPGTTRVRPRAAGHGAPAGGSNPARGRRGVYAPPRPERIPRTGQGGAYKTGRTGSKQVVSVRGRRVVAPKADPVVLRFVVTVIVVLAAGVAAAMGLSGVTTQQTFVIEQLKGQEKQLDNRIESLTRDVEQVRASADVARRASEHGMVVADQPGIITVDPSGVVTVVRMPDPTATRPVIDVNGSPVQPAMTSSDPDEIARIQDSVVPSPRESRITPGGIPRVAPYEARGGARP